MKEIQERQSIHSEASNSFDCTKIQAKDMLSKENFTGKALMTAEQELRVRVQYSLQERLAHVATAEEKRGLPPSPENRLPLGLDPQRYSGLGGCRSCVYDERRANALAHEADKYSQLASVAKDLGDHELAVQHSRKAQSYAQQALPHLQSIANRHPDRS